VELTNEDVADILALLDSLPYDELDLQTSRFRLTLRRGPDGGWSQSRQVTAEPQIARQAGQAAGEAGDGAAGDAGGSPGTGTAGAGTEGARAASSGAAGAPAGGTAPVGTGTAGAGTAGAPLADVIAPLPGTFYRAPRPGAEPFVEVGSRVSADTVVAIVETMKLMNSVHAGTAGRITQVLIANGEAVTQGAALMRIEPAS
jgi:acetyl-CoA carboxylase biotin carboxyl carrier protein